MDKSKRHELKAHLKEKFGNDALTPSSMNEFMESQSRDLLFCLRCMNLVRGMNRDLGGNTADRFIAFGTAASRGAKLSSSNVDSPVSIEIAKEEANLLTQSDTDILAAVKESMNQPVVSELHAMENRGGDAFESDSTLLLPRTFSDTLESYNILFRTWWKGLLIDLFLMLSGSKLDISSKRIG